jgi:hypothetical protein
MFSCSSNSYLCIDAHLVREKNKATADTKIYKCMVKNMRVLVLS